jgi:DME family drug/metabolite transporter
MTVALWHNLRMDSIEPELTERRAMGEVLVAAVMFGTTGTARALGAASASPLGVGAARLAIGGAVLIAIARRAGQRIPPSIPRIMLIGAGILTGIYQLAFFAGLDRAGVAVGTVVTIGSCPPLAGLIAMLVGQGRPTSRWCVATASAVAGVVLLAGPAGGVDPVGIALALLSALGYAGYTVTVKAMIDRGAPGGAAIAWAFGIGGFLLLPALFLTSPGWIVTPAGALTALYLGVVPTALAYALFVRGLGRLTAATVTTLVLAEPLVATLLGVVVLDERLALSAIIGCGLVLAGLVVLATGAQVPRARMSGPVRSRVPS